MASNSQFIPCGLVTTPKLSPSYSLPLKSVELRIHSKCLLASIEAVLVYQNDSSYPVEVEYVLPIDSITVITSMFARLEERGVIGKVRVKEEAKEKYDDAMSSGQTALYGEGVGRDMFRILLGNLSPGGRAELRVNLLQEMQREDGEEECPLRFYLPTTLKPRYTTTGTGGADNSCASEYKLNIAMKLEYKGGISRVESPSHKIRTGVIEEGVWEVKFVDANTIYKDLVVLIYPTHPSIPALLWGNARGSAANKKSTMFTKVHPLAVSNAFMMSFLPQFSKEERQREVSSEVIFVIDRSGSMSGEAIKSARATLELLLRSLSPGCAMNIVGFGTGYNLLFPEGSKSYEEDSLLEAVEYARTMQADMGSTDILSPLQEIFRRPQMSVLSRQVILLTDGAVSDTAEVLMCVYENRSRARVFAIGIGSGVSSELVRGVAEKGGGRAVFVSEGERMQGKILKLLGDAMSQCYTDVKVSGAKGVSIYPSGQLQLFTNERLLVYGFVEPDMSLDGHSIVLTYKYRDKCFSIEIPLQPSEQDRIEGDWIHKLACSSVLREWEQIPSRERECIQLSCDTNLVCLHTALVGVECGGGRLVDGTMQHIKIQPFQDTSRKFVGVIKSGKHGRAKSVGEYNFNKRMFPYSLDATNIEDGSDCNTTITLKSAPSSLSPHEQLISQQTAEGYWESSDKVTKLLNITEKEEQQCPKGMQEREWITLLCLVVLENQYKEFEEEWKLVAKKGWRWLRSNQSSVNLDDALKAAKIVLQ